MYIGPPYKVGASSWLVWLKIDEWQNSKSIRRLDHEFDFPSIIMIDTPYILANEELDFPSIIMIDAPYVLDISKGLVPSFFYISSYVHIMMTTIFFSYQWKSAF